MKKMIFLILLSTSILSAQNDDGKRIKFKMIAETVENEQTIVLNNISKYDEEIAGDVTLYSVDRLSGSINKNFDLLNIQAYGFPAESSIKTWHSNGFVIRDLEEMTNGYELYKSFIFKIKPLDTQISKDSIGFYIKYGRLASQDYLTENLNANFYFKYFKVPFNKELSIPIIDETIKDFKIKITFTKIDIDDFSLDAEETLIAEIIESSKESKVKDDLKLKVSYYSMLENWQQLQTEKAYSFMFEATSAENNLLGYKKLNEIFTDQTFSLKQTVYHGKLKVPFIIYNKQKSDSYSKYSTKDDILVSTYNIFLVPIELKPDTLIADLFIKQEKLNLNDGISRWTPIKKRVSISKKNFMGVALELPKENWSANFSRKGEEYNIYGYSDFDKYVKEKIIISFDK